MTDNVLPRIVITGASGFIGRNFVETYQDNYQIFAIARRSQQEVGIPRHKNITWLLVDVADAKNVHDAMDEIKASGGADYFIHLAAFFDFSNEPNEEYHRTNVQGSQLIFEAAADLVAVILCTTLYCTTLN